MLSQPSDVVNLVPACLVCYTLTGHLPQPEVSWSGIGSGLSALAM